MRAPIFFMAVCGMVAITLADPSMYAPAPAPMKYAPAPAPAKYEEKKETYAPAPPKYEEKKEMYTPAPPKYEEKTEAYATTTMKPEYKQEMPYKTESKMEYGAKKSYKRAADAKEAKKDVVEDHSEDFELEDEEEGWWSDHSHDATEGRWWPSRDASGRWWPSRDASGRWWPSRDASERWWNPSHDSMEGRWRNPSNDVAGRLWSPSARYYCPRCGWMGRPGRPMRNDPARYCLGVGPFKVCRG